MKLINLINAANVIAPKDDIKYYLNGVAIHTDPDTGHFLAVSATDGHRLFLAHVIQCNLAGTNVTILSKEDIKLVNLKFSHLEAKGVNGVLVSELKELFDACQKIDGRYPNITRVIPETNRTAKLGNIGLNVKYLADLHTIHKALNKGIKSLPYPGWAFNFGGVMDSATAKYIDADGIEYLYVLMPTRF